MAHAGFPNGLGTNESKDAKELQEDSDETRRRLILEYQNYAIGEIVKETSYETNHKF